MSQHKFKVGQIGRLVEPDTSFASELQVAIDADRGESSGARDPAAAFALVNTRHRDTVGKLMMPVVLYHTQEGYRSALVRLKMLLSAGRP